LRRRWSYAASSASSEAYDMVGERGPGNPLFPTNFARLALGPTLTAKYVLSLSLLFISGGESATWVADADAKTTLIAIPLYGRAVSLPRRRSRTRTRSAKVCCADDAASRVGQMGGTR
jgi:hypothetical protein